MSTSYETLLVAADLDATAEAIRAIPHAAVLVPAAPERVAVIPREGSHSIADLHPLGVSLSATLRRPVLAMYLAHSDILTCVVYRDGAGVHRYVSDQAMTVEWFEDDDGEFKPEIDGVVYPADHVIPEGPLGADASAFLAFAVQPADSAAVGAALRGEIEVDDAPRLMPERQHAEILTALGLPPEPFTTAYRHVVPADFPAALVVP